jgi:small subunit ribosomal protein S8
MSIDSIGNFLTIVRNGIMASKRFVVAPYSKVKDAIAQILLDEGFINHYEVLEKDGKKFLKVDLRYVDGESVIHQIERISTPGRRVYEKSKFLKPVVGKLGIAILTTNRGIISDKQAKDLSVGGEVICTVW